MTQGTCGDLAMSYMHANVFHCFDCLAQLSCITLVLYSSRAHQLLHATIPH